MRPRICLAIISSTDGKLTFRESLDKLDYNKRRANFFKQTNTLSNLVTPTIDNLLFSNGVDNAIAEFKSKKYAR